MSLESLFQHIIFTEHQAEESHRALREVRSKITRCREKIKRATEDLNQEKIKLESKDKKPESTHHALRLLHDLQIGEKKLLVKVDSKIKAKLDELKSKK